jgi:hypothetical protein
MLAAAKRQLTPKQVNCLFWNNNLYTKDSRVAEYFDCLRQFKKEERNSKGDVQSSCEMAWSLIQDSSCLSPEFQVFLIENVYTSEILCRGLLSMNARNRLCTFKKKAIEGKFVADVLSIEAEVVCNWLIIQLKLNRNHLL